MHDSAKFRLHMPSTYWNYSLRSSDTTKIDLYGKHWENKLQVLTKTAVLFEYNAVQTCNLYDRVHHKLKNRLLANLFLYNLSSAQPKMKSIKKNQLRTNNPMSHELMAITHHSIGQVQPKIFKLLFGRQIDWYPGFNYLNLPSLHRYNYQNLHSRLPIEFND